MRIGDVWFDPKLVTSVHYNEDEECTSIFFVGHGYSIFKNHSRAAFEALVQDIEDAKNDD